MSPDHWRIDNNVTVRLVRRGAGNFSGWNFNGPGFEPTGAPLFETGASSDPGSYSDPTEDKLINETETSSSLGVFDQYATYTANQLPFIWLPSPYVVQAVSSNLATWRSTRCTPSCPSTGTSPGNRRLASGAAWPRERT
jgi:hypothetical protein